MERTYPKISFVIPCFNEEDYIAGAIESIQKQKMSVPYEIIIVDNASTDNSVKICDKYGVLIIHDSKRGLTFARQKGLEKARGELIVYMDADTRIPDNFTSCFLDYFKNHTDTVCASYRYYYFDGRLIDKIFLFIFQSALPIVDFLLNILHKPEIIFGLIMVIRTDALKRAGGINEKFVFFGEDAEIARSLYAQGKVRYLRYPSVATSARRYKNKGIFKTVFLYWLSFLLIYFGKLKRAEDLSQSSRDF